MSDAATCDRSTLSAIAGIEDYWSRLTLRSPADPTRGMADKIMLDVLGLGIEQALTCLMRERPDFASFERWVLATAGTPDPERVARYNAWVAGAPAPDATAERLRTIDAMAPVLAPEDLAHWDEQGYVVLRAALCPSEAAECEALLWRLMEASPEDPASWYRARTHGIMVQHFQHPALEVARRSPRIHKAFAQLLGTSDLWSTTDRMSFNPPMTDTYAFPGPELHWDVSLAQPMPLATGGILYLTDTAANGGALRVVPGLHLRISGWLASLADADPRRVDLSHEAAPVPGSAGDLVIWRQELAHGASANRAAHPRMAQYVNFYSPATREQDNWL